MDGRCNKDDDQDSSTEPLAEFPPELSASKSFPSTFRRLTISGKEAFFVRTRLAAMARHFAAESFSC